LTNQLRTAIAGLICDAAAEESMLLTSVHEQPDGGDPECWAARPTVIHNSDFRAEQIERLIAIREGRAPQEFPRVDHASPEVYAGYLARAAEAAQESRATHAALLDELALARDEDLLDPARHRWLRGRHLWLQIIVRGFWHPLGHVGEYYLSHGCPERAIALHRHAVTTARYLNAPDMALGMAHYSLACAHAVAGQIALARAALDEATMLNPDLDEHARHDPDLEVLQLSSPSR
jgi:hypothetical protein